MEALQGFSTGGGSSGGIPIDHPFTMQLTEEETERASAIKAAAALDESLAKLSDFEYVQYALTHGSLAENFLPDVLHHMARMQLFRQEYRIQDENAQEGTASINAMASLQPGLLLALKYLPVSGNCIAINDVAAFFPRQITTPQQHASFMIGSYYRFQAMSPTFLAIRKGMSKLFECEGASWENYDASFQQELLAELYLSFPKRHKEMCYVNSPTVINVAHGLWKRYMNSNMKESIQMGYQIPGFEGRRLDELFKTPTPELAQQRMMENAEQLLRWRYHHQATFQLPVDLDANMDCYSFSSTD